MNSNKQQEPLVSVVTPFYNSASFLPECIESVLGQTHRNWEYVLLDNCSTDDSLAIAKKYAASESRIRLIEASDFLGQIQNYNRALRAIDESSIYTKVLEADNWLYDNCLEKMVRVAERYPDVDLVSSYNTTEHRVRFFGYRHGQEYYSGNEAARLHFLQDAYLFGAPTTVMYRSSAVRSRDPFYPEDGILAEDLRVSFDILRSGAFAFVPQILNFVRTDNESILSAVKQFDPMVLDRIIVLVTFGRHFLSDTEYDAAIRTARSRHYHKLAEGLVRGQRNGYMEFHECGLQSVGETLSRRRLAAFVAWHLLGMMVNPGRTLRALYDKLTP